MTKQATNGFRNLIGKHSNPKSEDLINLKAKQLEYISVIFLALNTTSKLQLLDQDIIRNLEGISTPVGKKIAIIYG
ncbi:hypothetical protein Trydic_g19684 [Trypoxylus dichotomus]